mgnify:CR=1 FL=1
MTYVITSPCVDVKDLACVEECPGRFPDRSFGDLIQLFPRPLEHVGNFDFRAAQVFAFVRRFHKSIQVDGFFRRHGWDPCAKELNNLYHQRTITAVFAK